MTPSDKHSHGAKSSEIPSALEMTIVAPGRAQSSAPAAPAAAAVRPSPSPASAPAHDPPHVASAPIPGALVQALRRRWLLGLLCATLAAVLAAAAVFVIMPPRYVAAATLQVDSRGAPGPGSLPALLASPRVLSAALDQQAASGRYARDLSIVRERGAGAVAWLAKALTTDYDLDAGRLTVTLAAERGDEAADLLNGVVAACLLELEQGERNRNRERVHELHKNQLALEEELNRLRTELAEREKDAGGSETPPFDLVNLRSRVEGMNRGIARIHEEVTILRANPGQSRVAVLEGAAAPPERAIGRQTKLAGAAGAGMFVLGLLGVAWIESRRRIINGAADVSRGLGLTVVGTVPSLPESARRPHRASSNGASSDVAAPNQASPDGAATRSALPNGAAAGETYWQNRLMESIDGIRTLLLHAVRGDNLRIIMVTSAVGGEGKTSLASQLAASLARAWKKTLLIDGDLRHPAAHRLFDAPLDPGFSEVLRGDADLVQAIKATALSRLWVMPAGHWDAHAVQALAQDQVRTKLLSLKQQYDFVIVDSCPVLPVADALVLGQHVDGVLFSVMRDVSRLPALRAAQERVQNLGVRTLGAVVIGEQSDLAAEAYKYAMAAQA
jgi:capsular exopolysaccharide synthesis family protein